MKNRQIQGFGGFFRNAIVPETAQIIRRQCWAKRVPIHSKSKCRWACSKQGPTTWTITKHQATSFAQRRRKPQENSIWNIGQSPALEGQKRNPPFWVIAPASLLQAETWGNIKYSSIIKYSHFIMSRAASSLPSRCNNSTYQILLRDTEKLRQKVFALTTRWNQAIKLEQGTPYHDKDNSKDETGPTHLGTWFSYNKIVRSAFKLALFLVIWLQWQFRKMAYSDWGFIILRNRKRMISACHTAAFVTQFEINDRVYLVAGMKSLQIKYCNLQAHEQTVIENHQGKRNCTRWWSRN